MLLDDDKSRLHQSGNVQLCPLYWMAVRRSTIGCVPVWMGLVPMMPLLRKYKYLVDNRGHEDYYVRGTFTKYNHGFC